MAELFERNDVRETPLQTEVTVEKAVSTAQQDITLANSWTDVTGATVTFTLTEKKTAVILASALGTFETAVKRHGIELRANIDTVSKTNSTRSTLNHLTGASDVETSAGQEISISTQFVQDLSAGEHTIKLEAKGFLDEITYAVRLPSGKTALTVILL